MAKKIIKLTESDLHNIIQESVKNLLFESDDFIPHGYKTTSNWGGYEMQLSDNGDSARIKDTHTGKVSEWMEIEFDEDGVAYVKDSNGDLEKLSEYMRY